MQQPILGNQVVTSAAFTAFDGIPMRIMADGPDGYPGWDTPIRRVERPVPRGERVYRQNLGPDLARITLPLEFDREQDYRRFLVAHNTDRKARLTMLAGAGGLRGEHDLIHVDYVHYDGVVIDRVTNEFTYLDGVVSCTATFAVAWDPLTMKAVP